MNITTPVIINYCPDGINDRIDGLDGSADDYLCSPCCGGTACQNLVTLPGGWEILSRVPRPPAPKHQPRIREKGVSQDPENPIAENELALMEYLIRNKGQVLPRGLILLHMGS